MYLINCNHVLSLLFVLTLAGCRRPGPTKTVPVDDAKMPMVELDVPADISVAPIMNHNNTEVLIANSREAYKRAYYHGWCEFWGRYKTGEFELTDKNAKADVLITNLVIEQRGLEDGFENCRKAVIARKRSGTKGVQPKVHGTKGAGTKGVSRN